MKTFDQIEAKIKNLRNKEEEILIYKKNQALKKEPISLGKALKLNEIQSKISVLKWVLNV
ncbi:MAG: hypothetical protein CMC13_00305 [Flavobacteriaceae bacterium]|nr:hypothetical protein [Flavobacteriaceae bacterium]|tara:strand:- start:20658 stop:20837 length:180 start_codon:yes stop_codon:yes gene_type:complete